jgi:hypothetical protein
MPIPSRATIKANFETGKKPTQAQYHQWIDATYDLSQGATTTAEAALADVLATLPLCMGSFYVEFDNSRGPFSPGTFAPTVFTKFREQDCTFTLTMIQGYVTYNAPSGPKPYKVRIQVDVTFATAAANTTYTANYALFSKTIAGCSFYLDLPFLLYSGVANEPPFGWFTFTLWP